MFGTVQRIELGDSLLTEDVYSSTETEELEQLFNAGMNNGREKVDKEETNQQVRKLKMKIRPMTLQKKQ